MAFTQITVTGTFKLADGTAAAGEVWFTPRVPMTNSNIVVSAPVTATLDGSGAFSVSLAATDDTGTLTADGDTGTYLVEPIIAGQTTQSYQIVIGHGGGSLNLGNIIATVPVPTVGDYLTQTQANALYAGYDADLTTIGALSPSNDDVIQRKAGAWTNRTIAQLATDLTASAVQPKDADLTTIAGLTATTDNFLQAKSSAWASRTPTQVAADLVTPLSSSLQPLDADLTTIAGLTATTDSFMQAKSSAWAARTIAQVKTDLAISNVDNTSDANKPLSTAEQAALNLLDTGEEIIPRDMCSSVVVATSTGNLRLSYFTARKTETTTQVRVGTGTTAAAATPTLCRIGLYTIDGSGDGTLVASIANDTALFASISTAYTRSWSVSYAKVAGQRYALGVLVVTAGTAPLMMGVIGAVATEFAQSPRLCGVISGQSDLPSSFVVGSVTASANRLYGAILP